MYNTNKNNTYAAQFKYRVEVFALETTTSPTSERIRQEVSKGKRWMERMDKSGQEVEEGKLTAQTVTTFKTRFETDLLTNGNSYFIRDLDGDFYVKSVIITGGRRRYLELNCIKNG